MNNEAEAIFEECEQLKAENERLRKVLDAAIYLVGYKSDAEPLQNVWQREGERVAGLDELRRAVEEYRAEGYQHRHSGS